MFLPNKDSNFKNQRWFIIVENKPLLQPGYQLLRNQNRFTYNRDKAIETSLEEFIYFTVSLHLLRLPFLKTEQSWPFRSKQRFHLNPFLFRIFSTSSSSLFSQLPSNFFTKKPLVDRPRNPDDVFVKFAIRRYLKEQPDETQSRVAITELPKGKKRRKAERPKKKQLEEQKPKDGKQSRAASISGARMKKLSGLSSSSRNALKNHPDYICSGTHAMDVLNGLSRVKKWSPLYRASMDHLMADVAHRQAFLTFSDPEDMIRYKTQKMERE